jgi:hypothetical protein
MRAKEFIKENDIEERPKIKQKQITENDGYDDDMVARIITADAMPSIGPMSADEWEQRLLETARKHGYDK